MKSLVLLVLLNCLGAIGSIAQSSYARDAESKIVALEHIARMQACEAKDLRTLDTILDEGFVLIDEEGKVMNKAQVLAYVQTATSLQYLTDEMVVKVDGDTAIVTGLYQAKSLMREKAIVRRGRFVDTWRYNDGRWVAVASVAAPNE
ncbi:MAG TPA: nuclear transport factor 2 family protein [Candidatus Sulfotelmatobacter sp.]|jgi:ketosteroid isomerase-like protein|nr:nuclear transport factor 2 family protein [Candidatus Sulfotelmatobacter sp.]